MSYRWTCADAIISAWFPHFMDLTKECHLQAVEATFKNYFLFTEGKRSGKIWRILWHGGEKIKTLCSCHENIKFISSSLSVMFFLLYRHTEDGVFDPDFPKISDHFPKISEDFPKLFRRPDEQPNVEKSFRRLEHVGPFFRYRKALYFW